MRLVKIIINEFKGTKTGVSANTQKPWAVHEFLAHETDFDGSRIPVIAATTSDSVRDVLIGLKGQDTMLPFTKSSTFNGKESYNVSDDVLRMSKQPLKTA